MSIRFVWFKQLFFVELLVSNELNSFHSFTHTYCIVGACGWRIHVVKVNQSERLEVGALEEAFGGYTRLELPLVYR